MMSKTVAAILVGISFSTAGIQCRADEYVGQANKAYQDIKLTLRSDLTILPLIAAMDRPPAAARDIETAMLMPVTSAGWPDCAIWAQKPAQQAALEGLKKITERQKGKEQWAFGLPYGTDGVPLAIIKARAYAEVGDPPTLSAAQLYYQPMLVNLAVLVQVEATRLVSENKGPEAADLMLNWICFARQLSDRQFYREATWGLDQMQVGLHRLRDVLYSDFRGARTVDIPMLQKYLERLSEKDAIQTDRIKFPRADLIGAEQIVARVFIPRKGPDERVFATTLASIGSASQPMRLFSEAARWRSSAASHKDQIDTSRMLDIVFGDFSARWPEEFYSRRMLQPYEYSKLNQGEYSVILATIPDMESLINQKQAIRVEAVGTRLAIAHLGLFYERKSFGPTVASVQPFWQKVLEKDPFNISPRAAGNPPMEYFVPIRDQPRGPREDPKDHVMNIVAGSGTNFAAPVSDDTFVIYSVGSDNHKNWAERIQNTIAKVEGADYLIWPPLVALERKHLHESGLLK